MPTASFCTLTILHRGSNFEISCFVRPGKEETIVYLHGLGSTKFDFYDAVHQERFNNCTLFAFDFPGSGMSSYCEGLILEMDDLVQITGHVLAVFDFTGVTLVGHSMGGLIALRFSEKHTDTVKRVINVEGNLVPEDCDVFSRRTAQLTWDEFRAADFVKTLQAELASLPHIGARLFADQFPTSVNPHAFHDYCVSIVEQSDRGTLMPLFRAMTIPRLFIYGEANKYLTYLSELPAYGIQVVEVPASHHWPHLDNPDYYFQAIANFIAAT